jgi:hypothetical protein
VLGVLRHHRAVDIERRVELEPGRDVAIPAADELRERTGKWIRRERAIARQPNCRYPAPDRANLEVHSGASADARSLEQVFDLLPSAGSRYVRCLLPGCVRICRSTTNRCSMPLAERPVAQKPCCPHWGWMNVGVQLEIPREADSSYVIGREPPVETPILRIMVALTRAFRGLCGLFALIIGLPPHWNVRILVPPGGP